ncbi:hypothetical protein [Nocardioides marmorisolisilvae]|uniref:Uncharacterized protein n=1 Tax=Nocardioides marmorisolisilvae TaxID=1542737 RepID=A0A3N0DWW4_9ACTN|nr:hypothetical protein [Nocardioides marmorisolisilvae]RNL80087.1 hypothetical protein EFL95_14340 [Nocardioides marmorisolisilvae]
MRPAATRAATALLATTLALGLGGCRDIPKSATVKDFCSAGEKFSASTTFKQGVSAAKKLADTGTPKGIPQAARDGFVQLIDRVLDAKNGQDFIKKSKKLNTSEQKNLKALDAYIKKTCTA